MAQHAHRDGRELEVDVGVVVEPVGQAGDLGDEGGAGTERTGAEARGRAEPHVAPVGDAIGLLELPGRQLPGHQQLPVAVVGTIIAFCLSGPQPDDPLSSYVRM